MPKTDDYRKDTLTLRHVTHEINHNIKTGKSHIASNTCNPTIAFFNSPLSNENFTPIYTIGWGGAKNGVISFQNDSEFVLLTSDTNINRKSYYKLTKSPELDNLK